jgi:hypothetical protein
MNGADSVADTAQRDWHRSSPERSPQFGRQPPPLPFSQRQPDLPEPKTSLLRRIAEAARGKGKSEPRLRRHSGNGHSGGDGEQVELPGFLGRAKR